MGNEEKIKPTENKHYGHAVRRLRQDRRLSQKEFGMKIGMAQQTVCRYEDQLVLEDEILQIFAKGLNVSVDFIKKLEDDKFLTYYSENNTGIENEKNKDLIKELEEEKSLSYY